MRAQTAQDNDFHDFQARLAGYGESLTSLSHVLRNVSQITAALSAQQRQAQRAQHAPVLDPHIAAQIESARMQLLGDAGATGNPAGMEAAYERETTVYTQNVITRRLELLALSIERYTQSTHVAAQVAAIPADSPLRLLFAQVVANPDVIGQIRQSVDRELEQLDRDIMAMDTVGLMGRQHIEHIETMVSHWQDVRDNTGDHRARLPAASSTGFEQRARQTYEEIVLAFSRKAQSDAHQTLREIAWKGSVLSLGLDTGASPDRLRRDILDQFATSHESLQAARGFWGTLGRYAIQAKPLVAA